ncbi:hypothetical protein [Streptomyces pilosus]|uniref:hypothetical protein n=1 Tax=Streptomyces pilosus TaxID=28893 RepID=UPI00362FB1F3
MHHPHTPDWHAHEEADERAWLDDWARLHCTRALEPPTPTPATPTLTLAGSLR